MDTPEQSRPLIGRLRRALLGKRAGTISSAIRNVDSIATYGHQDLDANLLGDRDAPDDDRT